MHRRTREGLCPLRILDEAGLGDLLLEAYRLFRVDLLIASMMFVGGIAFLIDKGIRTYEERKLKWLEG